MYANVPLAEVLNVRQERDDRVCPQQRSSPQPRAQLAGNERLPRELADPQHEHAGERDEDEVVQLRGQVVGRRREDAQRRAQRRNRHRTADPTARTSARAEENVLRG